MGDNKRSVSMIADMDASSRAFMSKKRKPNVAGSGSGSSELELCSSGDHLRNTHFCEGFHGMTVSPTSSVNSAGTVVSGEILSGRSFSCCSSNVVKTSSGVVDSTTPLPPPDLEAKSFEILESTCSDIKLFRDMCLLSESFGDSEETVTLQVKSPSAVVMRSKQRNIAVANMPPKEEIEEFFALAEKYEQKRFAEKYNYDIAKDKPLEGRYQWVRLN